MMSAACHANKYVHLCESSNAHSFVVLCLLHHMPACFLMCLTVPSRPLSQERERMKELRPQGNARVYAPLGRVESMYEHLSAPPCTAWIFML